MKKAPLKTNQNSRKSIKKTKISDNVETKKSPNKKEKPDLTSVMQEIRKLLKKYESPLTTRGDDERQYHLWSEKDLVIEGRKRKEVYFAGLIIQSDYVGFYYMPVYAEPEMKKVFSERLLKMLKGKSCFHIKELDKELIKDIKDALDKGFKMYKENGWV